MVKNLPAMQETEVRFLVWEDPLENGMGTHFFHAEKPGKNSPCGHKESDMTERLN